MSLAPSTDLVLEVSRAADPARAGAVRDKLTALASGSANTGEGFQAALGAAARPPAHPAPPPAVVSASGPLSPAKKAQRLLESAFLTQFINEMLPKDSSAFGSGYAGDMWRSMLAERVADQVAASGRLGIGERLFAGHPLEERPDQLSPERMRGLGQQDAAPVAASAS